VEGPEPLLIYKKLRAHFGYLNWWPAESDFEVFVGAMLTQQTSWRNVELALANLKGAGVLSIESIARMPLPKLQRLIRPSGFYRQKAIRLKSICAGILKEHSSFKGMMSLGKDELRERLLSYIGIGYETADSIILYAAHKPSFVIDAYTKRAMHRIHPKISEQVDYEELKSYFESRLRKDTRLYKDFHAQFVELGKNYCQKTDPDCAHCPIREMCSHGQHKP